MFKYKTLSWKTPKPNFGAFFELIGIAQTFRKPGRHVVNFMYSNASQEYPKIFLEDREPIKAREKHYSLVGYMLTDLLYTQVTR